MVLAYEHGLAGGGMPGAHFLFYKSVHIYGNSIAVLPGHLHHVPGFGLAGKAAAEV